MNVREFLREHPEYARDIRETFSGLVHVRNQGSWAGKCGCEPRKWYEGHETSDMCRSCVAIVQKTRNTEKGESSGQEKH